jgi:hypothetical protein
MIDEKILYRFLNYEYPDNHSAIYLYCVGQNRSQETAKKQINKMVIKIFCPPYTVEFINKVVVNYLEFKKSQYQNGEINITPVYS